MEYGHVHMTHITLINLKNKIANNHSSHTCTEVSIFLIKKKKNLTFALLAAANAIFLLLLLVFIGGACDVIHCGDNDVNIT